MSPTLAIPPPPRAASATPKGGGYQPQIDGLRAVAIIAVLLHHFGLDIPDFLEYGPISVRLFFALTGYFMTIWLWKAMDAARAAGISAWREVPVFHARRLLRLCPPLYLSLLVAVLLGLPRVREDILWHVGFATNFYVMHTGYWPPVVSHLWSLAVQEQFYVLWPVLILLTPRRYFVRVLVGAAVAAFAWRFACIAWDVNPVIRWTMLIGSLDSFATGALIAWLAGGKVSRVLMTERQRWSIGLAAFACLMIARYLRYEPQGNLWVSTIEVFEAVFIGWVVASTAQGWRGPIGRLLGSRWLGYLGKISLGIYLFHVLVHIVFGPLLDRMALTAHHGSLTRVLALVLISVAVAMASWHLFEKPLSRLKPSIIGASARRAKAG